MTRQRPRPKPRLGLPANESGFTLVELIVVMGMTLMMTVVVISFFFDLWGSTATLQSDSETFVTRQNSGDLLRDEFNAASGLINQNGIADSNTENPDPLIASGQYWERIHAIPGATNMPASGTVPVLYFAAPSIDSSKNFIMNGTSAYSDNFVLYMDASTKSLMLRTLANPNASGNRLKTSCPPATATSTCPADRTIAKDVSAISTRFFSRSGNLLDWTSIVDPITGDYIGPDFPSVEVVEVTLALHRNSVLHGGEATSNQTIIRVAFRNG